MGGDSDHSEATGEPRLSIDELVAKGKLRRFKLLRKLGAGAMAAVVLGEDTTLERPVALKLVPHDTSTDERRQSVEQFIHEARAAARLVHPNVVQIFEVGVSSGYAYIAMEVFEAGDLQAMVDADGPMDWERACELVAQAAEGLDYAHEHNILHRDIKPANLMLTSRGHCKLADFGVAQMTDAAAGGASRVAGTPYYQAPEAVRGEAGVASDIYSLASVLWHLLTGKPPFAITKHSDVQRKGTEIPLPDLNDLRPDVPDAVCTVLVKALAADPGERYDTAERFATALRHAIQHTDAPIAVARPARSESQAEPPSEGELAHRPDDEPAREPAPRRSRRRRRGRDRKPRGEAAESTENTRRRPAGWIVAVVAALLVGAAVAAYVLLTGGDDEPPADADPTPAAVAEATGGAASAGQAAEPEPSPTKPDAEAAPNEATDPTGAPAEQAQATEAPDAAPGEAEAEAEAEAEPEAAQPPPAPKIAPSVAGISAHRADGQVFDGRYVAEPAVPIRIKPSASHAVAGAAPAAAFDGEPATLWAAHPVGDDAEAWIEADLGQVMPLGSITLHGLSLDDPNARHALYATAWPVGENLANAQRLALWTGAQLSGGPVSHHPDQPVMARYVHVRTRGATGPVLWREIALQSVRPTRPASAADADPATWWSMTEPGESTRFTLAEPAPVNRVDIAFGHGERRQPIVIRTSTDGERWQRVFAGRTAGSADRYESFAFEAQPARHVQIMLGPGATMTHLAEVAIIGPHTPSPPAANRDAGRLLPQAAPDGLVGTWTLDGDPRDSGGLGHHGRVFGQAEWVPGVRGRALRFAGKTTVDLGDVADFRRDKPFTFAAFVKHSSDDALTLLSRSDRSGNSYRGYDIALDRHDLRLRLSRQVKGNAIIARSGFAVPKDQWAHVAVSYSGSGRADGVKFYVDGKPVPVNAVRDDLTKPVRVPVHALLGGRHDGFQPLIGVMDEVHIYDRALEATAIERLAQRADEPAAPNDGAFPLTTLSVQSTRGVATTVQDDGSILADPRGPQIDDLALTCHSRRGRLASVILEALPDASLPLDGPGTGRKGLFALGDLAVSVAPMDNPGAWRDVEIGQVLVDNADAGHPPEALVDGKRATTWIARDRPGQRRVAVFNFKQPVEFAGGCLVHVALKQRVNLGRFRLLGSVDPQPQPDWPDPDAAASP